MKNITMSNTTPIIGALFAFPQAAVRSLTVGVCGVSCAPTHKTAAVKDFAYFRSWKPPV
ncbi:MAG: hypothetical protein M3537_09370 [Chloroflexota bacterium]|nr:hypothetical protein [Chloroflexota bacterium]